MTKSTRPLLAAVAFLLLSISAICAQGAPQTDGKQASTHRLAIQVDQNDPAVMNLALNNAKNALEYYNARGERAEVEIVAYGPGLNMLRADTSPVKERIANMASAKASLPSKIVYSACNNTLKGMEKREGHPITIIPQARIVPAGVVRLMELQEQGWSYVRP
jgi:intracellular sulfur oxidation DsrE/DsrF family protein